NRESTIAHPVASRSCRLPVPICLANETARLMKGAGNVAGVPSAGGWLPLQSIRMDSLMTRNYAPLGEPVKVLIADDSALFRKLVEQTLSAEKYALVFAKTGHEAIQLFEAHHPALVIVDWMMPDLTGIEICQHIRSRSQASYTYTIILTGMAEKENVVAGLAAG